MPMPDSLSIRAYTPDIRSHKHDFHQVVLPLKGVIEIAVNDVVGVVGVGQMVIIRKGITHSFHARSQSRFLVADLDGLPENAHHYLSPFAAVSDSMQAFCHFVDAQLQSHINADLETSTMALFRQLLAAHKFVAKINDRLSRVLAYIDNNLGQECSLQQLALIANLSPSHFKSEFKKQIGKSCREYLTMRRMEKARALLTNTDYPVQIIAEKVGYTNPSAFSRRFSRYFGESPQRFKS